MKSSSTKLILINASLFPIMGGGGGGGGGGGKHCMCTCKYFENGLLAFGQASTLEEGSCQVE